MPGKEEAKETRACRGNKAERYVREQTSRVPTEDDSHFEEV